MPPHIAIGLTEQILGALGYAHRRGIVHRDVKPQNVILDPEGQAKVADFGIARAGNSEMTQTGAMVGTVQYLSPEQAKGYPVDRRSDLYSTGIVLYELLTGHVPFDGEAPISIALKHVNERPVPPGQLRPGISPALEAVVMRALEKDPNRRYQSAEEFIAALEQARRAPHAPRSCRARRRADRRARAALALVGVGARGARGGRRSRVGAYFLLAGNRVTVPNLVGRDAERGRRRSCSERGLEARLRGRRQRRRPARRGDLPEPGGRRRRCARARSSRSACPAGPGTTAVPDVVGGEEEDAVAGAGGRRLQDQGRARVLGHRARGHVISTSVPSRAAGDQGPDDHAHRQPRAGGRHRPGRGRQHQLEARTTRSRPPGWARRSPSRRARSRPGPCSSRTRRRTTSVAAGRDRAASSWPRSARRFPT